MARGLLFAQGIPVDPPLGSDMEGYRRRGGHSTQPRAQPHAKLVLTNPIPPPIPRPPALAPSSQPLQPPALDPEISPLHPPLPFFLDVGTEEGSQGGETGDGGRGGENGVERVEGVEWGGIRPSNGQDAASPPAPLPNPLSMAAGPRSLVHQPAYPLPNPRTPRP